MSGFQHGELVLCSKPYAYVLSNKLRGHRCDYCFKKKEDLKCCSECSFVYFCDETCQEKGQALHKLECKYIKEAEVKPSEVARFVALLILKFKEYGQDDPFEEVLGRKVTFGSLMSHSKKIVNSESTNDEVLELKNILNSYIGPANIPDHDDFIEILGKMQINSFSISDDVEMEMLGRSLYLGASAFDHSCEPDAEFVFDGVNLCIRAYRDIPHRDLSKITISYIQQLELTRKRQDDLMGTYFFHCTCSRCVSPKFDNLMTKMLIDDEKSDDLLAKANEGLARLHTMVYEDVCPSFINEACVEELLFQDGTLADTNIYKVKTLKIAFSICMKLGNWADAIIYGTRLLDPYRIYFGSYGRNVGLHLFWLGQINLFHGSSTTAADFLSEAKDILEKTHGEDHPLFQDLLKLLDESQK